MDGEVMVEEIKGKSLGNQQGWIENNIEKLRLVALWG